ncbi:hypothetical protein KC573_02195, partial [candidate division WWE3 bacterium]|nr:hypothetical protein [candidate division WWE3 bacterium]
MFLDRIYTVLSRGIIFFSLFFLCAFTTHAASFPADYDVSYTIDTEGVTTVQENITITNRTDTQYPSQYTLALEGIAIQNVQASDAVGPME